VDAIAHEYEFGEGDHKASERTPLDWFRYQVGMHSFRAFAQDSAEDKPTWILNYSWDGDNKVDAREAMMNLAMSQLMAGANFWDAPGHSMAGSNDLPTRKKIFAWIGAHEKTFYLPRSPIDPIGVYFSPRTRDFDADEFITSYRGVLILLMEQHLEFEVVTPRSLAKFRGQTLVLPDVRELSTDERSQLQALVHEGKNLVISGADATGISDAPNVARFAEDPGKIYEAALEKDFEHASPDSQQAFVDRLGGSGAVKIKAGPHVATSIARTSDGRINVFLANFTGLVGGSNPVQTPQTGIEVSVVSKSEGKGFFLPFLGDVQPVEGVPRGNCVKFTLPEITKGAVFWVEQQ
jgi:hypothetical protein